MQLHTWYHDSISVQVQVQVQVISIIDWPGRVDLPSNPTSHQPHLPPPCPLLPPSRPARHSPNPLPGPLHLLLSQPAQRPLPPLPRMASMARRSIYIRRAGTPRDTEAGRCREGVSASR